MEMEDKLIITNCFDSHVHLLATGQVSLGLHLHHLTSAEDIQNIPLLDDYYCGEWLIGFGWNHYNWKDQNLPNKAILDRIFPETPVLLSRVDGHASWLNSKALDLVGFSNSNGILLEQEHIQALTKIPSYNKEQLKRQIYQSIKIFNLGGFTHVRDMSMTLDVASVLKQIYDEKKLTLCVEAFVTAEGKDDLDRAYQEFLKCQKLENPFVRMSGIKIFVDGSLGSKTAYISKNYENSNQNGQLLWETNDIEQAISFCWERKIEVAVHTIGDLAVKTVLECARKVSAKGLLGKINLEHVQIVSPQIVSLMKPLHIRCHMQPCHWLSDKTWIKDSIGDLYKNLFQWELLRKNKIELFFGSDSPIEKSSIINNYNALNDSAQNGIPSFTGNWMDCHSYPDKKWTQSRTVFSKENIIEVYFDGNKII